MALETGTYINQLVPSNPNGADPKGQGDDHIRLIKNVLKNTFPNITGPIQCTQAQIDMLLNPNLFFTRGMVMQWYGDINAIPGGWLLCNGAAGTPDMRDRFVVGAGLSYGIGASGGATSHNHGVTVYGTALTEAQIPSHTHGSPQGHPFIGAGAPGPYASGDDMTNTVAAYPQTLAAGGSQAHTHGGEADWRDHRPPYFALAFIMRA